MMEFTTGQENVFKIFDDLIDSGISVEEELSNNAAMRRRVERNFDEGECGNRRKNAMFLYGFNDVVFECLPLRDYELEACLFIDESYRVVTDDYEVSKLADITNNPIMTVKKEIRDRIMLDKRSEALDMFVEDHESDFLACYTNFHNMRHIRYTIDELYGDMDGFRKAYGIDYRLSPDYSRSFTTMSQRHGHAFEKLVERCFASIGRPDVTGHKKADSLPDFVLSASHWADAKLSKSTAFARGCRTIEKYCEHVDKLTIIYAIDNSKDLPEIPTGVELLHVYECFPNLPKALKREIDEFIMEVNNSRIRHCA